jgi:hypothetical protein
VVLAVPETDTMKRKDHTDQRHHRAAARTTAAGPTGSADQRKSARPRRTAFRQADVSRALKGASAAGIVISRIEIDQNGKIVLVATTEAAPGHPGNPAGGNEWDEVLK